MKDLGLLAVFALVLWAPLGRWIVVRLGSDALPDDEAISIALGLGAWGLGVLALGLAGLLYRTALLILAAVLFLALGLRRHLIPHPRACFSPGTSWLGNWMTARFLVYAIAVLSGVYLALVFCSAPAPELAFDALNVHLPYARDAAAAHRAGFVPNNWSSVMPALPLMSYITAFLFSGLTLARLFNVLCYVVCGAVVMGFAGRRWGGLHASAAALLFWSSPVALYEATTALIDLPLTLFSALALLSLLAWTEDENASWLWLSAAALGLAFGCKYHAAFWAVPILAIASWDALVRRRMALRGFVPLVCRYSLIVFLLALPWLVRAWVYTGNPVFPVANSIFRSALFPPSMEAAALAMYSNEGVGTSLPALLRLPWSVTFHPGPFRGTLGILFLPGALLALLRGRSRQVRYGLIAVLLYFLAWALTAQEIRYLLPLLPLLCMVTVAGFLGEQGLDNSRTSAGATTDPQRETPRPAGFRRWAICGGVFVIIAGSLLALPPVYSAWTREWTYWHSYQSPIPFLLGRQSAEEYLRRDVPSIYVYDYVNRNLSSKDRILLLNDAAQYYSKVPTLYSFTVEGEELLNQTSEEGVLERLRQSRITYVLLNYSGIAPLTGVVPRLGVYFFLMKSFQDRYLEPVCSRNNVTLYRVRTPS